MLKFITPLYFVIAAVSGDWPPQDHGQNQVRFPVPPQKQNEPGPVFLPQQGGMPVAIPRARPCQRRNLVNPTGWVLPPPTQQPFESQLVQPQLKPQSLTENRVPANDDNNEAVKSVRNSDSPYKSVEKYSTPSQISDKTDQDIAPHTHAEDEHYHHHHHTSNEKLSPHEHSRDSHECEPHEEVEHHEKNDVSERIADDPVASEDVHERAVKLLSKCVQEAKANSPQEDFQGESRRSNQSPEDKNGEVYISSKSKPMDNSNTYEDSKSSVNKIEEDLALERQDPQLYNPAKGAGNMKSNPQISLLQNGRVCYACSTYFDASCWKPNGTTTVKYCYKTNNACVTRTFKVGDKSILTRDCGNTCNEDNPFGVGPKHTSCSMCHTDLCNSAYAIHSLNVLLVTFLIITVKITLQ